MNSNTSAAEALHLGCQLKPTHRGLRIHFSLLCHADNVDVVHSDMEERGRAQCDDGRPDVRVGYDLYSEDI